MARTSTLDQQAGLEAQVRDLEAYGAERIFAEHASSVGERPKLAECLRFVREGDVLVVTRPDRLARSAADLLKIVEDLNARNVGLVILSMGGQQIDSRTATGKLMLTMLAAVAAFERDLMLERQREGIAKAAAAGKYKGRKPTARAQADKVMKMAAAGWKREDIAEHLCIGVASVYRILSSARKAAAG